LVFSQEKEILVPNKPDSSYREDQFYINITYNSLRDMPVGVSQNGFSPGISFGFLRDFPLNEHRNIAVAPGFGFSMSGINQNLVAQQMDGNIIYSVGDENEFNRNRLSLYMLEIPVELRWRTSTADSHKFWRIYAGFKTSYVVYSNLRLTSDSGNNSLKNNSGIDNLQFGSYITFGFNTWNFYLYYGFNPIYDDSVILSNQAVKMAMLNLGLQFYIL
jgi:hypothetical protein